MTFLGVGPLELILILILGLVVLGPERLQELARTGGRLLARLLAWQQQSPEAQMIQQIRTDFDREVTELRDEILRARDQLKESAKELDVREELNRLKDQATEQVPLDQHFELAKPAPKPTTEPTPESAAEPASSPPPADEQASIAPPQPARAASHAAQRSRSPLPATLAEADTQALSQAHAMLVRQINVLTADLHALETHLRARQALDEHWVAPSVRLQQRSSLTLAPPVSGDGPHATNGTHDSPPAESAVTS